ncbi:hypothetical protein GOP47_0011039 [Adiantum capillus-veneris]|uniref:Uncharacterized protein n=1 Tax=Adiantum capillus-veneris TaxID=13818 RepID=A0A9D4US66_ADICA|nr:hypothetical protein GOP47_0011039 [Adiantum capillus-veneris]
MVVVEGTTPNAATNEQLIDCNEESKHTNDRKSALLIELELYYENDIMYSFYEYVQWAKKLQANSLLFTLYHKF